MNRFKKNQLARVYRLNFSPDYDHEIWLDEGGEIPTPTTYPDAFYLIATRLYSSAVAKVPRQKPHARLSHTQIRKRLYQAGVRGADVRQIAMVIWSGPQEPEDWMGLTVLGWNIEAFKRRFGKRIARSVLRFVQRRAVFQDEFWKMCGSAPFKEFVHDSMHIDRKSNHLVSTQTSTL